MVAVIRNAPQPTPDFWMTLPSWSMVTMLCRLQAELFVCFSCLLHSAVRFGGSVDADVPHAPAEHSGVHAGVVMADLVGMQSIIRKFACPQTSDRVQHQQEVKSTAGAWTVRYLEAPTACH